MSVARIVRDGLWDNNAGIVQLLGLCPLLAVSTTVVNGLGLGLATMAVLIASNGIVSLFRRVWRREIRIAAFVIIIASLVTAVDLILGAYFFDLHRVLGLFVPLIVTNCAIIGRAESFAARQPLGPALVDGAATGAGFALVLVALGAMREIIGQGTLFADAQMLFGPGAEAMRIDLFDGFLLAALPPGAFFGLAFLVAAKNAWDQRRARPVPSAAPAVAGPAA